MTVETLVNDRDLAKKG